MKRPTVVSISGDKGRQREAQRRLNLLRKFHLLISGDKAVTRSEACRKLHCGYATLWRWQSAFDAHGLAGLVPGTKNSGRRPAFAQPRILQKQLKSLSEYQDRQRSGQSDSGEVTAWLVFERAGVVLDIKQVNGLQLNPPASFLNET